MLALESFQHPYRLSHELLLSLFFDDLESLSFCLNCQVPLPALLI